jgi:hypothetical protein
MICITCKLKNLHLYQSNTREVKGESDLEGEAT